MTISIGTVAFGSALLGGAILFAIGRPTDHAAAAPPVPAYAAALNQRIAANAAALGPHAPPATVVAAGVTLRSVGFDLPTTDREFPPGPGAELVGNTCQSCHSPGMILNQPALTQAEWTGEVTKMLHAYKAPLAESDVPAIVAYLVKLKVGP